jgi:hypothetical protein
MQQQSNIPGTDRPRRLLLCLDGVPLEVIKTGMRRGLFNTFHAPSRLLSPFPTLTNIALSTMLGATPPPGYESLYFDRGECELRGGISKYIGARTPNKAPSSYMEELDYQEPLPFEFLVYVAPETVWKADMRRFHERFKAAPRTRDYFAFLKGTDGLLHIRGPKRLEVALASLSPILEQIQATCGSETEIVLFSDHGMNLEENRRVHMQGHLRDRGYELSNRRVVDDKRTVSIPAFGLCGYAALYCREELSMGLADNLSDLEGVDFSVTRNGPDSVYVTGARGSAYIHRRVNGSTMYRYEQLSGDPLSLNEAMGTLRENSAITADGTAADADWFRETTDHIYPDVLSNIYNSLQTPRVGHNADVLVSMRDGYYYGSSLFSRMVKIEATHGNAMRASTSAFIMSTHRRLPSAIRASEARQYLRGSACAD